MPYTKTNSKGVKDLNIRAKMIKFLDKNIRVHFHDFGFGNDFLDWTPKSQVMKEKT